MNNARYNTLTKIQAKDLQIGMNVNFGAPVKVTKLEDITFKNGNPGIIVHSETHHHVRRDNCGHKFIVPAGCKGNNTLKPLTWVKVIDA